MVVLVKQPLFFSVPIPTKHPISRHTIPLGIVFGVGLVLSLFPLSFYSQLHIGLFHAIEQTGYAAPPSLLGTHLYHSGGPFVGIRGGPFIDPLNPAKIPEEHIPLVSQGYSFLALSPPDPFYKEGISSRKEIVTYTVREAESLSEIAASFGVSVRSIMWANHLTSRTVRTGQTLTIPPTSGIIHTVQQGDTCGKLAAMYRTHLQLIEEFNQLGSSCELFPGEILIIPEGILPSEYPSWQQQILANALRGFLVFPTTGRISQGLHRTNAVDISNLCGTPIVSAADGTVIKSEVTESPYRSANRGYGNFLKIEHAQNIATVYAHLQTILIHIGDKVSQGQTIAFMGGQPFTPGAGRSTGCHLHFEVHGTRNPFAR